MPEEVKEALRAKRLKPAEEDLNVAVQAKQNARKAVEKSKPKVEAKPTVGLGFQGKCILNPDGATHAA